MKNKGIILFDIDKTIFDTHGFSRLLELGLSKIIKNASIEEIKDAKSEFVASLSADREFDPKISQIIFAKDLISTTGTL